MKAYLEPKEIERLENTAINLRDRLLIRLLFHLGCRISEALAIRVEDIGCFMWLYLASELLVVLFNNEGFARMLPALIVSSLMPHVSSDMDQSLLSDTLLGLSWVYGYSSLRWFLDFISFQHTKISATKFGSNHQYLFFLLGRLVC